MPSPRNWFIGLPFPAAALPPSALEELPAGTRTFDPADLHITVAFLGPVGENRALAAWACLADGDGTPLDTHIGRRAVFGPPGRPTALGLDLDAGPGENTLTRYIAAWRNVIRAAAGLDAEQRPVRPHLTLGRPPRRPGGHWHRALAAWLREDTATHTVVLDRIALYTRADAAGGRRFRQLRRYRWSRHGPIEENTQ